MTLIVAGVFACLFTTWWWDARSRRDAMRARAEWPDIVVLTADQAWANYCAALHLSRLAHTAAARQRWDRAARWSLDVYFARLELRRLAVVALTHEPDHDRP